jgi:hypothetical protein
MPRSHRFVLCALPLLAAACGGDDHATTPPSGLPVTIDRSGGIAGFSDHVVVAADGWVTATSKGGGSAACRVDDEVLAALARLAGSATGSPSSTSQGADSLTVVLSSSKGTVSLDPGALPSTAPELGQLLNDLGRQPSSRAVCH